MYAHVVIVSFVSFVLRSDPKLKVRNKINFCIWRCHPSLVAWGRMQLSRKDLLRSNRRCLRHAMPLLWTACQVVNVSVAFRRWAPKILIGLPSRQTRLARMLSTFLLQEIIVSDWTRIAKPRICFARPSTPASCGKMAQARRTTKKLIVPSCKFAIGKDSTDPLLEMGSATTICLAATIPRFAAGMVAIAA